jgi:serine/threonine-protein kinase RsbW
VGVVRLALASLARTAGLDEEEVDDLKIAVSEACANAVLAQEESGSDEPVTISWSDLGERFVVEVGDRGRTQDAPESAFDSQGFSSRAVLSGALLQSLADEVEYLPREGGGTQTRITFSRHG